MTNNWQLGVETPNDWFGIPGRFCTTVNKSSCTHIPDVRHAPLPPQPPHLAYVHGRVIGQLPQHSHQQTRIMQIHQLNSHASNALKSNPKHARNCCPPTSLSTPIPTLNPNALQGRCLKIQLFFSREYSSHPPSNF